MPDLPFTLAETSVDPIAMPVTTPALGMLAIVGFCTDQKMLVPVIGFPDASCTIACNGTCDPTATVGVGGVTETEATSVVVTTSVVSAHAASVINAAHAAIRPAAGVRK